jgi:hypothetical protein
LNWININTLGSINEDYMNVKASENQIVIESIQKSNDLLKMIAAAKLGVDEKMMKADVVANVESNVEAGVGEKVDIEA